MTTSLLGNIFLGCFLLGFILTSASLLFGVDMDHHGGGGHYGGGHAGDAGGGDMGGADISGDAGGAHHGDSSSHSHRGLPSYVNYNTIVMFLTWFGATGFLMTLSGVTSVVAILVGAVTAGLIGGYLIFLFINKVLMTAETKMDPTAYYMPGTIARVTSSIRSGGTGEIVYVQGGTRKTAGARSDEQRAHKQGEEVVIVRYEKGLAYVRGIQQDLEGFESEPLTTA